MALSSAAGRRNVTPLSSRVMPPLYQAVQARLEWLHPDSLRMQPPAVAFAKSFFDDGKPVASICHGPWTIIETGYARGRRMTSWPSLKTDLRNAGSEWVDQQVIRDGNLVTSRKPDDIPAFNAEVINLFSGASSRQATRV